MAENPVEERRLAAILAADVVGYSKMMGEDEAGTLSLVRSLRSELIEPKIVEHKGRLFKTMGDGFLAEFPSVVNAVACAVAIQKVMTGRNTDLPDDRRVELRIGVHLGDVIAEGGDVYGDGVNVAARIEGLAPAGGVAISGMVYDNIGSRLDVAFEDMGDKQLKNIARPVRVHCMAIGPLPTVQTKQPERTKPSIAVLPFLNMSGDVEQEYFSDGITEDIITELSRFRMLSVIARNSSFQYRDKAVDVRRVRSELGAQYVVEGSVRKMGDRVRITTQLIDADTGNHIWSERYDRSIGELFDVQDEVTRTIVSTITGRLEDTEISRASRRATESVEAHDLFLRGIAEFRSHAEGANQRARELFEQAIAVDPAFAAAHAEYSSALLVENGFEKAPQDIREKALDHALLAVRLDPRDSRCHSSLGWAYRFFGEFGLAVSHTEQGLKLNPNDAGTLADMASVLVIVGRAEEGVVAMKKAMELNPYHPDWYWSNLAMTLFAVGRYEESLAASAKLGRGKKPWTLAREAACFAQLGRMEEARRAVSEVLRLQPDFRIIAELPSYQRPQDKAHVLDAMKKAGLPE